MDLKTLFQDFNHSKFVVFSCLLPTAIFISLKLDGYIDWSLWIILVPLWLLKLIVILGAIVGTVGWYQHPESRNEADGNADFKAMLMTLVMQLLLLIFELLVCNKVENQGDSMWIFVFMPLYFISPIAVAACIWGFRHDRSLELEAVLSINILLFIFVALRLDGTITWSWTVIFIPLWIAMCLPGVAVLYYLIWTLLFFRSNFPGVDRRSHLSDAIMWIVIVIPILTFQVLLAHRLDDINPLPWINVFIPLYVSLVALIWSSFGRKGGNKWWFGLREDCCLFLLHSCPFLRVYGNVEYKTATENNNRADTIAAENIPELTYYAVPDGIGSRKVITSSPGRYECVVPMTHITTPD